MRRFVAVTAGWILASPYWNTVCIRGRRLLTTVDMRVGAVASVCLTSYIMLMIHPKQAVRGPGWRLSCSASFIATLPPPPASRLIYLTSSSCSSAVVIYDSRGSTSQVHVQGGFRSHEVSRELEGNRTKGIDWKCRNINCETDLAFT